MPSEKEQVNDREILLLCQKVEDALRLLSRFSEKEKTIVDNRETLIILKPRIDDIERTVNELRNLIRDDSSGHAILNRLQVLEGQIHTVTDEYIRKINVLEKDSRDMQESGRTADRAHAVCRKEVDERLANALTDVDERFKAIEKNHSERSQIKWAIFLLLLAQIVQWLFGSLPVITHDTGDRTAHPEVHEKAIR